jgi:hypothetical protein
MPRFPTKTTHATRAGTPGLVIVASLVAAACVAGPINAAAQTSATPQASVVHHHYLSHKITHATKETLELRIATLHGSLKITPDEETKWSAVAQVMRDNQADMQRLVSERHADATHQLTAVEDMKIYEHFNQTHVDGLKNLISSFETLYAAMPSSQQAVADGVFRHFGGRDHLVKS